MFYSDLHIHSKYSRATSSKLTFPYLLYWATLKGITLLGTGDILHSKWQEEFQEFLLLDEKTGFYKFNTKYLSRIELLKQKIFLKYYNNNTLFIPTVETSHIYKDGAKVRRIHLVTIFRNLESAKKISTFLSNEGYNLSSDGRPIMGLSTYNYLQLLLNIIKPENFILIPAHIWTPWFALLGSKSGYNSIKEAFRDLTSYIKSLETGLSSDPKMNRLIPEIDNFLLVSNSDAHSPQKLGREANIHTKLDNIETLFKTLTTGENLYGTIEFYPQEGRYFGDGHRKCNIYYTPEQSECVNNLCPKCGKPLTLGVLHRVHELSKLREYPNELLLQKYKSIYSVPLTTIIAQLLNKNEKSVYVSKEYFEAIRNLGPELKILHELDTKIIQAYNPKLACLIRNMREGNLEIKPGYDGLYGRVKINSSNCQSKQLTII